MFEVQELELAEPQTFFILLAPRPTLSEPTQRNSYVALLELIVTLKASLNTHNQSKPHHWHSSPMVGGR